MPRSAGKSRSAFSISNMLAQGQQSRQQIQGKAVQPQVCEPVTQQDLERIWARLCENAAKEKRIGLHTAMNAADVRMEGESVIGITVSSTTAEHELEEHMLELLERIRTALRNTSLTHRITVNESVRERLPYTPREKYEYLRKKNPLIENMRAELDLNIDF